MFENTVLVLGIVAPVCIIGINVVLRNFFTNAITWAEEFARFCIIGVTFVGLGVAVREKAHMRITAIYDNVGPKKKVAFDLVVNAVAMAIAAFLLVHGTRITMRIHKMKQVSPSMGLPMWIMYATIPVGCALMIIRLAQDIYELLKKAKEQNGGNEE